MNLDNEYEACIVDQLLKNECRDFEPPVIGMRVNPVVGGGKIGFVLIEILYSTSNIFIIL